MAIQSAEEFVRAYFDTEGSRARMLPIVTARDAAIRAEEREAYQAACRETMGMSDWNEIELYLERARASSSATQPEETKEACRHSFNSRSGSRGSAAGEWCGTCGEMIG